MAAYSVHDRRPYYITITFNDGDEAVDMAASWTSDEIPTNVEGGWSVDALWEGADSPVGVLYLEVSNGLSWGVAQDLLGNELTATVSGASSAVWDNYTNTAKCRLRYVRTSGGSGDDLTAIFYTKG